MRPIARKYDLKEHAYPVELDTLFSLFEGASESIEFAGANALGGEDEERDKNHNGANMAALLQTLEASWGDLAMMLSVPYQGLGNAAISAVANEEQLQRLGKVWAAMAITEPGFGSDSAAVSTTATLDGDEYVINGEKIFVTAGSRATHIVVWATLDKSQGRAAIKSFVVPREHPGVTVERLEHKLGIKGSDTAVIRFDNARIPKENLLGNPEIEVGKGFSGVMETFDNTRPIVAAMAVGVGRAALEDALRYAQQREAFGKPIWQHQSVGNYLADMATKLEAARQLVLYAARCYDAGGRADMEAGMAKLFASETAMEIALNAVRIHGGYGYSTEFDAERYFRDAPLMIVGEGTNEIQRSVITRQLVARNRA
jgi:acyl-CoA dehydrogenase